MQSWSLVLFLLGRYILDAALKAMHINENNYRYVLKSYACR